MSAAPGLSVRFLYNRSGFAAALMTNSMLTNDTVWMARSVLMKSQDGKRGLPKQVNQD